VSDDWPLLAALAVREARMGASARRHGPFVAGAYEFLRFGIKQAWACLFGGALLGLIVATRLWYPHGAALPRYDALVVACVALQVGLLLSRLETIQEAKVILAFHLIGTAMELFKTSVGSWDYPEASYLRLGHVPLFTGFMYGAVGSYLTRVWRLFDFRFAHHPPLPALAALSVAIYANFFTDHWGLDLRYLLLAIAGLLFRRTIIYFKVWTVHRRMPLLLGFFLVALFIWFGENIATAGGAWLYPNQVKAWNMVSPAKLTSWSLLMLISYSLVAAVMLRARDVGRTVRQLVAAVVIVACGLIWRLAPLGLPAFWRNYGGSVLWGAMVLLIVGAFDPGGRRWKAPLAAAAVALAVELFKLYHVPGLDAFRLTLPGALLFGRVFNPWNVMAYWVGIAAAIPMRAMLVSEAARSAETG